MSKCICIMGESGSGKTTAMRTLDPSTTLYIDCDGKGLSWKGWRNQYNKDNKNYIRTDEQNTILTCLKACENHANYKHFKTVIIDTINSIMVADERRRRDEKTYDKWSDLAWAVYDIVTLSSKLRDDLTIILLAHTQTEVDENNGERFTRILTNGKKLNKIGLEKYLTTVLISKQVDGKYVLLTKDANSTCKAPLGAFDTDKIDNDISIVLKALEEF